MNKILCYIQNRYMSVAPVLMWLLEYPQNNKVPLIYLWFYNEIIVGLW